MSNCLEIKIFTKHKLIIQSAQIEFLVKLVGHFPVGKIPEKAGL